jgi:hypothetical protein
MGGAEEIPAAGHDPEPISSLLAGHLARHPIIEFTLSITEDGGENGFVRNMSQQVINPPLGS